MKEIYFIRHAKSSWADPSLSDIDRPLNGRGKRDAPFMASKLAEKVPHVGLILSSSAKRARKTASHFRKAIRHDDYVVLDDIYHAWPENLLEIVQGIDDSVEKALLFGHNPGFTSVYNKFSDEALYNLPTCGIFGLRCSSSWRDLDRTNTRVSLLMYPKMYIS